MLYLYYRYNPKNQAIDYIDIVNITEPALETLIEDNRKMMERLDIYIRNLLVKQKRFRRRIKRDIRIRAFGRA